MNELLAKTSLTIWRKKKMRQILALSTLLTSIMPADAGGCRVVKSDCHAVKVEIPAPPVTAVVFVPTYTYSYPQPAPYVAPAYTPPQQVYQAPIQQNVAVPAQVAVTTPEVCDCNTLMAELKALRAEVRGLSAGGTSAPVQTSGEAILMQKCAFCHKPSKPGEAKGFFDMVDDKGVLVQFTLQQKRRIASMVKLKRMPPNKSNPAWLAFDPKTIDVHSEPLSNDQESQILKMMTSQDWQSDRIQPPPPAGK